MFVKLSKWWNKYGFEILLCISIVIIVLMALFRLGKNGTWSTDFFYINNKVKKPRTESRGEIECRKVLEELFNKPFPKTRPNFLKNPVTSEYIDNNLELDCYNDELKIAVEYNGIQHYKYVRYFHKTKDAYHNQKYRDHIKRELCAKNGIYLIEVPYTIQVNDIRSFLQNKLQKFL